MQRTFTERWHRQMAQYDFSKLLQDAKAGGAWPLGDYDFEVADAMVKKSNSSDNEMIVTKLRCLVGPYAGKHVTNNFVLTADNPTALAIFFRHMSAFGLDDKYFAQIGNGDLTPVAHALKGRRARITLGHREWNGAKQNDIKAIKQISGDNVTQTQLQVSSVPAPPPPPAATTPSPPPPPPSPAPAPSVAPASTAPTNGSPPSGYTAELWESIPDAARQEILKSQPTAPTSSVPPPPPLPV